MLNALKSNKLLLIILGVFTAIIIACLLAYLSIQSHQPVENKPPVAVKLDNAVTDEEIDKIVAPPSEEEQTEEFADLVDATLIEQPIADDPALVKDELVQLQDIQNQLNEQKTILNQQHQDADKLLELKEKQLAALEKQLAAQ